MKKILISGALALTLLFPVPQAKALFCVNCSTIFTQLFQYITDLETLSEAVRLYNQEVKGYELQIDQYLEFIKQTQELIAQSEELVKQTDNMIQNTINLPGNLKDRVISESKSLLGHLQKLKSFKADQDTLGEIYSETFPGLEDIEVDGKPLKERIDVYDAQYEKATEDIDNVLESAFGLSGTQLQTLEETGDFDSYLDKLLSSKEGNLDAIEAGNQIAGIIAKELREQRALTATYVQAQSAWNAQERQKEKNQQKELDSWAEEEIGRQNILIQPGS